MTDATYDLDYALQNLRDAIDYAEQTDDFVAARKWANEVEKSAKDLDEGDSNLFRILSSTPLTGTNIPLDEIIKKYREKLESDSLIDSEEKEGICTCGAKPEEHSSKEILTKHHYWYMHKGYVDGCAFCFQLKNG